MARERKTMDCIACCRRVPIEPRPGREHSDAINRNVAGEDFEASGMCDRCQTEIEERMAIVEARYERQGRRLSHDALVAICDP